MEKKRKVASKELADVVNSVAEAAEAKEENTVGPVEQTVEKPEPAQLTWQVDKGAGYIHIQAPGYIGPIQVLVNGLRRGTYELTDQRSIQLSGLTTSGDLFIKVVRLK